MHGGGSLTAVRAPPHPCRFIFFSNWLRGDLVQYDISDPLVSLLLGVGGWVGGGGAACAVSDPANLRRSHLCRSQRGVRARCRRCMPRLRSWLSPVRACPLPPKQNPKFVSRVWLGGLIKKGSPLKAGRTEALID